MQGLNQIRLIHAHQAAESLPADKGDQGGPFPKGDREGRPGR